MDDRCYTERPRARREDFLDLTESDAIALASVSGALSDPIRLRIVHLLEQRADLCTCEFEALLGLAQSRVSYHLKVLLEAGLIERRVYGTWSHYNLRTPAVLARLRSFTQPAQQIMPAATLAG